MEQIKLYKPPPYNFEGATAMRMTKNAIYYFVLLTAAFFCVAAFSNLCGEASAASKDSKLSKNISVSSRECKMLLLPEKFADPKSAMKKFWALVEQTGSELGLKVKKNDGADRESTIREVSFLDTQKFDLYKNCYIIRRRVENGDIGMTLKFRNPDVAVSSKADVSPGADYPGKTVMDEDVVVKEKIFEHVFSKSGKTTVSDDPEATIGSYAAVYPGLLGLGIPEKTPLYTVNGVKISETSIEYGRIHLSKNIKADASFSIWYVEGNDGVFIAEFSYKYKFENAPSEDELLLAHHASDKFLGKLRDGIKSWLAVGMTKTGMVYKFNASNAD